MAELAKARSMQPYIILYKTTLQLGVRNLPKVFTRHVWYVFKRKIHFFLHKCDFWKSING